MKLLFFDLETTGVNPGKNGIHQISGEIVIDGVSKEQFDFHVQPNPRAIIEDEALKVAGVTREQVLAYPPMIHPTEKPIKLYGWLLMNYAKPGDRILDTHLGSGSICIAAHDLGFEMLGIELNPGYFNAAKQRLLYHQAQLSLF